AGWEKIFSSRQGKINKSPLPSEEGRLSTENFIEKALLCFAGCLRNIAEGAVKDQVILENTEGSCRSLTLHRPESKNAFNFELASAVAGALDGAARDRGLKVVVLRGSGGSFSAGGYLKLFHQNLKTSDRAFRKITGHLNRAILCIAKMPQIVIAAV